VKPQASIFLALTDIPHGIEFLAGSHVHNQKHKCRRTWPITGFAECMDRLAKDCYGAKGWDMKAGDAILFYGSTFHWSVLQEKRRLAFSVRFIPADMMFTGSMACDSLQSFYPWKCSPLGGSSAYPVFYSTDERMPVKEQPWPVLPRNSDIWPGARALRRALLRADIRCDPIDDF